MELTETGASRSSRIRRISEQTDFAAKQLVAMIPKRSYVESNMSYTNISDSFGTLIGFGVLVIICGFCAVAFYAGAAGAIYLVLKALGAPV